MEKKKEVIVKKEDNKSKWKLHPADIGGVIIVTVISFLTAYFLGKGRPIADMRCHQTWMKITHRLPISEWYDTPEYRHLDYPFIAAYVHYLMGFIYRAIDPIAFYQAPIIEPYLVLGLSVNQDEKFVKGVRYSILACNVIFYYPVVFYVVLANMKNVSRLCKYSIIFILLTTPMYAFVEHTNTQANAPQLALFLLCFHFLHNSYVLTSIPFLVAAISYKQILTIFSPPIALYMMGLAWKRYETEPTLVKRILKFCGRTLLYGFIAIAAFLILALPLILNPPALSKMFGVISDTKGRFFWNSAPTLWRFLSTYVGKNNLEAILAPYKGIVPLGYLLLALIYAPVFFMSPTKKTLITGFISYGLFVFMFGFGINDKHVHYMWMIAVLYLNEYKDFMAYLALLSCFSIYSPSCTACSLEQFKALMVMTTSVYLMFEKFVFSTNIKTWYPNCEKGFINSLTTCMSHQSYNLIVSQIIIMACILRYYNIEAIIKGEDDVCHFRSITEDALYFAAFFLNLYFLLYALFVFIKNHLYYQALIKSHPKDPKAIEDFDSLDKP